MADAVKVGILDILAGTVWPGMNFFVRKRIVRQDKGVLAVLKLGVVRK